MRAHNPSQEMPTAPFMQRLQADRNSRAKLVEQFTRDIENFYDCLGHVERRVHDFHTIPMPDLVGRSIWDLVFLPDFFGTHGTSLRQRSRDLFAKVLQGDDPKTALDHCYKVLFRMQRNMQEHGAAGRCFGGTVSEVTERLGSVRLQIKVNHELKFVQGEQGWTNKASTVHFPCPMFPVDDPSSFQAHHDHHTGLPVTFMAMEADAGAEQALHDLRQALIVLMNTYHAMAAEAERLWARRTQWPECLLFKIGGLERDRVPRRNMLRW